MPKSSSTETTQRETDRNRTSLICICLKWIVNEPILKSCVEFHCITMAFSVVSKLKVPITNQTKFSSQLSESFTFQRALEILEANANYKADDLNYSRALAFRRASAVLKSLPHTVTSISQVRKLPDIGRHCLAVIQV